MTCLLERDYAMPGEVLSNLIENLVRDCEQRRDAVGFSHG